MRSPILVSDGLPRDIVPRYREQLQRKSPALLRRFEGMLRSKPGAAHLEAVCFAVLDSHFGHRPEINDDPSTGGADFKLSPASSMSHFVECKYLDRDAVTENSGLPDRSAPPGGTMKPLTEQIKNTVRGATRQLAEAGNRPTIAIVGTDHRCGYMVTNALAASNLLTSTTHIEVPIGRVAGPGQIVAPLNDSIFLARPPALGEDLAHLRVPISAVLLTWFDLETPQATLIGILNPWPRVPLDVARFPRVPFIRFKGVPTIVSPTLPPVEWVTC